jgi:hypothetical protein
MLVFVYYWTLIKFQTEFLIYYILLFQLYRIRIRIFIIPINGPTIGANKLHTLIIVIGGNAHRLLIIVLNASSRQYNLTRKK